MEGRQEALFFEYSRGSVYAGETETLWRNIQLYLQILH